MQYFNAITFYLLKIFRINKKQRHANYKKKKKCSFSLSLYSPLHFLSFMCTYTNTYMFRIYIYFMEYVHSALLLAWIHICGDRHGRKIYQFPFLKTVSSQIQNKLKGVPIVCSNSASMIKRMYHALQSCCGYMEVELREEQYNLMSRGEPEQTRLLREI